MTKQAVLGTSEVAIAAANASAAAIAAAKAASDSATVIAVLSTDVNWMKKSLVSIEAKLNEMDKAFVTAAQHGEVLNELEDHEKRVRTLEADNWKRIGVASVLSAAAVLAASFITKFIHL